jgi:hypothetical protein
MPPGKCEKFFAFEIRAGFNEENGTAPSRAQVRAEEERVQASAKKITFNRTFNRKGPHDETRRDDGRV